MRTLALVAVLLLPGLACASPGADARFALRCEREMKPLLEVQAREIAFDVSNTVASRVLHKRASRATTSDLMLGLTSGSTRTEISFAGASLLDKATARECIAPHITVELAYTPVNVFVAREFPASSCSYREIYAHEMRHVDIYRANLPLVEAKVREELARRYGDRPLYAAAGQGFARLRDDVDGWLRPLVKAELAKVELQQVELDSPEETFRMSHACMGEVASTLGSSF